MPKQLSWTEPKPPGGSSRYDHVEAETPFGTYMITWKSWKDHGDYCIEFGASGMEFVTVASDLAEAKEVAQKDFEKRLAGCQ